MEIVNQICAFLPALLVWAGGFFFFIRKRDEEKMPGFQASAPLPIEMGKAEAAVNKFSAEFLRELVRLAEEHMKEIDEVNHAYERKATLLASLSFAASGYLLSGISEFEVSWWGWIIYPSLGMVAVFSMKAIDFTSHAPRGLHPNVVRGFFDFTAREPNKQETNWVLYYMLETYRKGMDKNIVSANGKYKRLIWAKYCLVFGAGGFLGMSLESAGVSECACRWLANSFG